MITGSTTKPKIIHIDPMIKSIDISIIILLPVSDLAGR